MIPTLCGLLRNALFAAAILFAGLSWAAPAGIVLGRSHPSVRAAIALQEKITPEILQWPDVLGTAVGVNRAGQPNGCCCGGPLGSLIQVNGTQYILSNYHVFESDIVSGGNGLIATTGSPIIQPALIDIRCNAHRARNVGTLVKLSSLPGSN